MAFFMHLSREEYSEFVCGCGAAIINVGITFPINKIIFRQNCSVAMIISTFIYRKHKRQTNPYLNLL